MRSCPENSLTSISVHNETDQTKQPERHQERRKGLEQLHSVSSIPPNRWESLRHLAESSRQPLCQTALAFVSYCCCNKWPHCGGLSNTNLLSHSSGGRHAEMSSLGWNQGVSRAASLPGGSGGESTPLFSPAPPGCWQLLTAESLSHARRSPYVPSLQSPLLSSGLLLRLWLGFCFSFRDRVITGASPETQANRLPWRTAD